MLLAEYLLFAAICALVVAGMIRICRHSAREAVADAGSPSCKYLTAVFSALLLFVLVQSAIERRIGLDLFLPIQDGRPAVVRILCLGASLLFCFAAVLTETGRRVRSAVDRFCERDSGRFAVAFIFTALFFLWTVRVTVITFMTNDDSYLLRTISRIPQNGLASATTAFTNIFFCAILGFFYRLLPGFNWYTFYHLAALFVSCVIIGRCILLKTKLRGWHVLAGVFIHFLLCISVFLYSLSELSFTVTPVIVGSAAVALILCRGDLIRRRSRVVSDIATVLLMLFSALQRFLSCRVVLCFFGVAVVYQGVKLLLRRSKETRRQLASLVAVALVVVIVCFGVNSLGIKYNSAFGLVSSDFSKENHYRILVTDYLKFRLTDEQFESVGIPPELATLFRSWYLMDDRLNPETFKKLVDMYYVAPSSSSVSTLLGKAPGSLLILIKDTGIYPVKRYTAVTSLLLLILSAFALARRKSRFLPEFLCSLAASGGCLLICWYLVIQGRFPFRAILAAQIPTFIIQILCILSAEDSSNPLGRTQKYHIPVYTVLVLLFASCAGMACSVSYTTEYSDRNTAFAALRSVEAYSDEHPDVDLITSILTLDTDPFPDSKYFFRVQHWGDNLVAASEHKYTSSDDFFRDDIRFLYETPSTILAVLHYFTLDYGPVQAATDATADRSTIADISQVTPGEDYTGWYEQNGMTYYFENGEAVTGSRVIEGVEYEFAPAGNKSNFVIIPGDPLIYTTDAYSLITSP